LQNYRLIAEVFSNSIGVDGLQTEDE